MTSPCRAETVPPVPHPYGTGEHAPGVTAYALRRGDVMTLKVAPPFAAPPCATCASACPLLCACAPAPLPLPRGEGRGGAGSVSRARQQRRLQREERERARTGLPSAPLLRHGRLPPRPRPPRRECLEPGEPLQRLVRCRSQPRWSAGGAARRRGPTRYRSPVIRGGGGGWLAVRGEVRPSAAA